MRIQVLSSGSKGNILHLSAANTNILVDVGLNCKQTELRMKAADLDPLELCAILITHEHSDHICGVSVLSRRYKLPVYICANAWRNISRRNLNWHEVITFTPGREFRINNLAVTPFPISHDTSDPVAFSFTHETRKFSMATDLGVEPAMAMHILAGSDVLMLESNHDEKMLREGPYPLMLKRRISSNLGHLSNSQSANMLKSLLHPKLQGVILAHLSETNNLPKLAYRKAKQVLVQAEMNIPLLVGDQYKPTSPIEIIDACTNSQN